MLMTFPHPGTRFVISNTELALLDTDPVNPADAQPGDYVHHNNRWRILADVTRRTTPPQGHPVGTEPVTVDQNTKIVRLR